MDTYAVRTVRASAQYRENPGFGDDPVAPDGYSKVQANSVPQADRRPPFRAFCLTKKGGDCLVGRRASGNVLGVRA